MYKAWLEVGYSSGVHSVHLVYTRHTHDTARLLLDARAGWERTNMPHGSLLNTLPLQLVKAAIKTLRMLQKLLHKLERSIFQPCLSLAMNSSRLSSPRYFFLFLELSFDQQK